MTTSGNSLASLGGIPKSARGQVPEALSFQIVLVNADLAMQREVRQEIIFKLEFLRLRRFLVQVGERESEIVLNAEPNGFIE